GGRAGRGGPAAGRPDRAGPVLPVRPAPHRPGGARPGRRPLAPLGPQRRGLAPGPALAGRPAGRGSGTVRRPDRRTWSWLPRRLRFRVLGLIDMVALWTLLAA